MMMEPSFLLDPHDDDALSSSNPMVEEIKRASLKFKETRGKQHQKKQKQLPQSSNVIHLSLMKRGVEFHTRQDLPHDYPDGSAHNLNDLNAYVKHTITSQRQQRRRQCVIRTTLTLVFLVGVIGTTLSLMDSRNRQHNDAQHATSNSAHIVMHAPPKDYILSDCEAELNQNLSFYDLVRLMEETNGTHCRQDRKSACDWVNPTHALPRGGEPKNMYDGMTEWDKACQTNRNDIYYWTHNDSALEQELDVVLVGDSIVEHMEGKYVGLDSGTDDRIVFGDLFNRTDGAPINGVALGIEGDRIANLLYRLEHGEMPSDFNPSVWWITIGMEDWGSGLDADSIVAGILKIAHAIEYAHPEATAVVINSLLPRGDEGWYYDAPVYDSLHNINARLQCYADSRPQEGGVEVQFFDATSIFIETNNDGRNKEEFVNTALEPDNVHPNAEGEFKWGKKIVSKVLELTRGTS